MPGMDLNTIQTVYVDRVTKFDALEAYGGYTFNIPGNWDTDYGHVIRGKLLKSVTKTINGAPAVVRRPMVLGKVIAVNGTTVTLEKNSAVGAGLIGKTLTKVVAAGTVSNLAVTVTAIKDEEGRPNSTPLFTVDVTFSGAHGLTTNDWLGCEGLTTSDKASGISLESHNNADPTLAVVKEAKFENAKVTGPDAFKLSALKSSEIDANVLIFATF